MIDLEEQLQRHLRSVADRAEPIPDVEAVFADEPPPHRSGLQQARRSWLTAAAAAFVVVVGVAGIFAVSDLRSPSRADEPAATSGPSTDTTSALSGRPDEIPGITNVRTSQSTPESTAYGERLAQLLAEEYPGLELRESATRSTDSGHEVTWVYLLDGDRRLFVVVGPSDLIDASGFEWPDEPGATTVAVSNTSSTIIVRSEAIEPNGQPRSSADADRILGLAASLPALGEPAVTPPTTETSDQTSEPNGTTTVADRQVGTAQAEPGAAELKLRSLLALPSEWSIQGATSTATGEERPRTTQRWGLASDDPLTYDTMVELTIYPVAAEQGSSQIEFAEAPGPSLQADWVVGDSHFAAHAVGMTSEAAQTFIEALTPRDPEEPMAGFDSSDQLALVEEYIADRDRTHTAILLQVDIVDDDGQAGHIRIVDRPGLPSLLGIGNRRADISGNLGYLSPPDFPSSQITWATNGIQYTVSAGDETMALAEHVTTTEDGEWNTYLRRFHEEPLDLITPTVLVVSANPISADTGASIDALHDRGAKVLTTTDTTSGSATALYFRPGASGAFLVLDLLGLTDPALMQEGIPSEYDRFDVDVVVVLGTDYEQLRFDPG